MQESSFPFEKGQLDYVWDIPEGKEPKALCILAHGAGADMHHSFMAWAAKELCQRGFAAFRFQFPFKQAKRPFADKPPKAMAALQAACAWASKSYPLLPLYVVGRSFGGRMAMLASCEEMIRPRGLIFLGFPLHSAKKIDTKRAACLPQISCPMLFVQGDRDNLSHLETLKGVLKPLKNSFLRVIEDGDHSFKVRKTKGFDQDGAFCQILDHMVFFLEKTSKSAKGAY